MQPYYGHAVARCLVSEYLLKYFPYEDMIIYEIGAGNGTLAMNILDYLRDEHPEVYERTRYNIIEISTSLAESQKKRLEKVHPCVTVNNKSALHWDQKEPAPCYFIAMEVVVSGSSFGTACSIHMVTLGQLCSRHDPV
jgi:SAM-dependent MidA family methyltransferase